ncbi:MAG: phosphate ABC transporter permease PstA [Isosphaeraceae bacterium]
MSPASSERPAGPGKRADRYESRRLFRLIAGPLFGVACFLATLAGAVVLAVLLGSVIARVLQHGPKRPWYDLPGNFGPLFAFLRALLSFNPSSNPAIAGFRIGMAGSLWLLGLVAIFSVPVGVATAVFLEEYVPPGRFRRMIQMNIANLAGVPSIVYGILGLALFVRALGYPRLVLGSTLWSGALTLSLLILPVIVITAQEALRTIPISLRQAALALGATRWQMIRDHVLPAALPGILTGTILGLSRAIGETAPLLMVGAAGSIYMLPKGPSSRYTALPVEIYNYAKEPDPAFQTVAAGGILILLILLLSMNATAIVIRNRQARRGGV